MKRFIVKVFFFACFCFIVVALPAYVVDPYNVFHWNNIRNNGVEPNKNYIKTKYILNNPNKYDGFVFGSSRVGSIHVENIKNMKIYNMTYSAGTPYEHYNTLKTFIDNGVNIDIIYMGIDSFSYTVNPEEHNLQRLRSPYQYLQNKTNLISLYCDPSMVFQSLSTILKGKSIDGYDSFYTYGWWADYDLDVNFDVENAVPSLPGGCRLEETISEILEIKTLCEENDIKLVVFTNPMYDITYKKSVEDAYYLSFLEKLSVITDFYNFSSLNDITKNPDNYIDSSHYNAYVGDMILDVIINGEVDEDLYNQGFGWYVTNDNLINLIELLKTQEEFSIKTYSE